LRDATQQSRAFADADPHDDDLFADGDERRLERLRSIGTLKPEPRPDQDLPRFVRGNAAEPKPAGLKVGPPPLPEAETAPRRATSAWVFALLGFICGIGFWHAIGFWGFVSQIVLPSQRPAQLATSVEAPPSATPVSTPTYQPARPTRARP
jgi:hypothetical protein